MPGMDSRLRGNDGGGGFRPRHCTDCGTARGVDLSTNSRLSALVENCSERVLAVRLAEIEGAQMPEQGRKVVAAKETKLRKGVASGGRRERKLGALAGKIGIASDFDDTPPNVIEAFEG